MQRTDRIAEPWGTRTPYGPSEDWPTRVDCHLADGLTADDVDRWVQSATILHSNGDGLDIAVKDDRIVGVRGRAVDRVNHGRPGPKDLYGWQANNSPDRLTKPLIRRNGELVETDWDTAMEAVVGRANTDIDHADVIALYGHNMAETQTVLWTRVLDRLAGPNPPTVVCIDPRETPVARAATVSPGLGIPLLVGAAAMLVPAAAAVSSKVVPAAVMASTATRFAITGIHELTGSAAWKATAGWVGVALAVLAIYAALARELEGARERTVIPVGRRGAGRSAMAGEGPLDPDDLIRDAGVRPQL